MPQFKLNSNELSQEVFLERIGSKSLLFLVDLPVIVQILQLPELNFLWGNQLFMDFMQYDLKSINQQENFLNLIFSPVICEDIEKQILNLNKGSENRGLITEMKPLLKCKAPKNMLTTIKIIDKNLIILSQDLSDINNGQVYKYDDSRLGNWDETLEAIKLLSAREIEVFKLFSEGVSNKEASKRLNIAELTVKTHRQNIKKKLKIKNPSDLHFVAQKYYQRVKH